VGESTTTLILVSVKGVDKKLAYLRFAKDGSVYLYFPRKLGYRITKHKDLPVIPKGETQVTLEVIDNAPGSPYISYHPGKNVIHVNLQDRQQSGYRFDASPLDMSQTKGAALIPLCQILVPDFMHLDTAKRQKYELPLRINADTDTPEGSLSIDIWLHPVGTYFAIEEMPLFKERLQKTKFAGKVTFQSPRVTSLTATLVISENPKEETEDAEPGIIVAVFNNDAPFIFELQAIKPDRALPSTA
jgi:hypothetical protein